MTGEEMERAIEFLLQSQAAHDTRLDQLTAQVTEMSKQLQAYAQTQTQCIEICTRTMAGLAESQARTDERLNKLAESQQRTDEQINALIDIVREGRGKA